MKNLVNKIAQHLIKTWATVIFLLVFMTIGTNTKAQKCDSSLIETYVYLGHHAIILQNSIIQFSPEFCRDTLSLTLQDRTRYRFTYGELGGDGTVPILELYKVDTIGHTKSFSFINSTYDRKTGRHYRTFDVIINQSCEYLIVVFYYKPLTSTRCVVFSYAFIGRR